MSEVAILGSSSIISINLFKKLNVVKKIDLFKILKRKVLALLPCATSVSIVLRDIWYFTVQRALQTV